MQIIREACVETKEDIDCAQKGGADRIELCAALELGGLTPSVEITEYALSKNLKIAAMIRLRSDFSASSQDIETMRGQIRNFQSIFSGRGIEAFVFGFLTSGKEIDFSAVKLLLGEIEKRNAVFHMAFDEIPDSKQFSSIDTLAELGFSRILTKGGTGKALNNIERLRALNDYARGKITILCGGGVTDENYAELSAKTGITQFHGRKLAVKRETGKE